MKGRVIILAITGMDLAEVIFNTVLVYYRRLDYCIMALSDL